MGRGAPKAQRPVPLLCGIAEHCIDRWRHVADAAVRPEVVVVVLPFRKSGASVSERCEECLVEQLVAELAVEALDEGVLRRLAWGDVVPIDAGLLAPAQDRSAGQLGAIVADDGVRLAALFD